MSVYYYYYFYFVDLNVLMYFEKVLKVYLNFHFSNISDPTVSYTV